EKAFGRAVRTPLLVVVLALWLAPRSAAAHSIGLSSGEYRRTAEGLAVELVLAQSELSSLNERDVVGKIHVAAGASACTGVFVDRAPTDRDGVRLRARYRCEDSNSPLHVRLDLFDDLSHGHRHAAHIVSGAEVSDELCYKQHAELEVPPGRRE